MPTKLPQLSIRLEREMYEQLRNESKERRLSLNWVINDYLREGIKKHRIVRKNKEA